MGMYFETICDLRTFLIFEADMQSVCRAARWLPHRIAEPRHAEERRIDVAIKQNKSIVCF